MKSNKSKNKRKKKIKTTIAIALGVLVVGIFFLFVLSKSINMISPNLSEVIEMQLPMEAPELLQVASLYLSESEGTLRVASIASFVLFVAIVFGLFFGEKVVPRKNKKKCQKDKDTL